MFLFYADADGNIQDVADAKPLEITDEDNSLIVTVTDFGRTDHLVKLVRPPDFHHIWGCYY